MRYIEAVVEDYRQTLPSYDAEQATQEELEIMYNSPDGYYVRIREFGKEALKNIIGVFSGV